MGTCVICNGEAGLLSESCANCKERRSRLRKSEPINWEAIACNAFVIIFALVPSLLISAAALMFILTGADALAKGRIAFGLFAITVSCMSLIGTFALIRHVFGTPLHELRVGMFAGVAALVILIMSPFVRLYLASIGVEGMLPKENLAMGVGILNAVFCLIPLCVYSRFAYLSCQPGR